jgi:hypothetical protein
VELDVVHPTELGLLKQLGTLPKEWALQLKLAAGSDILPSNTAQEQDFLQQVIQIVQQQLQNAGQLLLQPQNIPPEELQYIPQLQQQQQALQLQHVILQQNLQVLQLQQQQQREAAVERLVEELQQAAKDLGSCKNLTSLGLSVHTRRWDEHLEGRVDWCREVAKLSKLWYLDLALQVSALLSAHVSIVSGCCSFGLEASTPTVLLLVV